MTFPFFLLFRDYDCAFSVVSVGAMLIIGVIHTGVAYFLYVRAIAHLKSSEISIMSYIDPLTSFLVSIFIFRETTTPVMAAGAGIMLLSLTGYEMAGKISLRKKHAPIAP